jgi:hypothetical protein
VHLKSSVWIIGIKQSIEQEKRSSLPSCGEQYASTDG